jgi:hypothetical protein
MRNIVAWYPVGLKTFTAETQSSRRDFAES